MQKGLYIPAAAGTTCSYHRRHRLVPVPAPLPVQALLAQHAADLRGLLRLTSLHFQLPPGEGLSLGTPEAAFITCLTGLQDLGLATGEGSFLFSSVCYDKKGTNCLAGWACVPGEKCAAAAPLHCVPGRKGVSLLRCMQQVPAALLTVACCTAEPSASHYSCAKLLPGCRLRGPGPRAARQPGGAAVPALAAAGTAGAPWRARGRVGDPRLAVSVCGLTPPRTSCTPARRRVILSASFLPPRGCPQPLAMACSPNPASPGPSLCPDCSSTHEAIPCAPSLPLPRPQLLHAGGLLPGLPHRP